jgi:hypothetical protein
MAGAVKLTPFDDYVQVVAVSGGKNTVKFPGKTELVDNVPSSNHCIPGQWLPMKKINGDRQQPILISPRRKRKKVGWTLGAQVISSLNWDMWRNSQHRGSFNNTNLKPTISNTEISVQAWPYGSAYPTKATSLEMALIHEGYVYGVEVYVPEYDWEPQHRVFRTPVNSWSPTYATSPDTGDIYRGALKNTPYDLVILDGYLFIWWQIESRKHITIFNLATMVMASDYYSSNPDNVTYRRIFYDSTYLYVIHDVAYSDYQRGVAKFLRSDGSYVSSCNFAWPTFDFQTNNGFLCYASEIRASIAPRVGNGVVFPTLRYDGSNEIMHEVAAFNLADGTLKWKYAPTSKTLTKSWLSYVKCWRCYSNESSGLYWEALYNTTHSLFYFDDCADGDKQIRTTLIACNEQYAFVLEEQSTIKQNSTHRSYDDWQQTAWKEQDYEAMPQGRYGTSGEGDPSQMTSDFTECAVDRVRVAYDSLAFDTGDPLPFQWIDRKEVFLKVLNILTGAEVASYGFSASESDTGTPDDITIDKEDLILAVRAIHKYLYVDRTKEDFTPYSGDNYTDFMGLASDEQPHNAICRKILSYWCAEWDPNTPEEFYWCGASNRYGPMNNIGPPTGYDDLGEEWNSCYLAIDGTNGVATSMPTGPGHFYFSCVAVKHPTEDVVLHTKKYVPTCFDFTKTLIMTVGSSTYIIVAPTPTIPTPPFVYAGRLGILKMTMTGGTATWSIQKVDIGPGDEFLHFCCNRERIYCFVGSDRTNCILYEINLSGTIVTTKTGVRICNAIDENLEPMIIDNNLVLVDTTKISYIGA